MLPGPPKSDVSSAPSSCNAFLVLPSEENVLPLSSLLRTRLAEGEDGVLRVLA